MPLRPVYRFDGHRNAHLESDLNHASPSHNARLSATSSAVAIPFSSILIRPARPFQLHSAFGETARPRGHQFHERRRLTPTVTRISALVHLSLHPWAGRFE